MKKKWVLSALILAVLCLSGCNWMDGSYVSVTPHVVTPDQASDDSVQISTYSQLRNALTDLVDSGAAHEVFSLTDYPLDHISKDIDMAINYVRDDYPIGAYAVEDITYEYGTDGVTGALSVDITYLHGQAEINRIQTVRGIAGAQDAISSALRQCDSSLTLQVTNYTDTDFSQLTADYAAEHPEFVMETPYVSYQVYPSSGNVRVVDMAFFYQTSRESLLSMQGYVMPVFSSAQLYVTSDAEDIVKYNQLYTFLTERFDYTIESSITPSYSLLSHGIGDSKAFAQVYAAMCRQVNLECLVVSGTRDGESHFWNIVLDEETYYHVDLLRSFEEGGFHLKSDAEMEGYVWDKKAYPVCGNGDEADLPTEPDAPTE